MNIRDGLISEIIDLKHIVIQWFNISKSPSQAEAEYFTFEEVFSGNKNVVLFGEVLEYMDKTSRAVM